MAVRRSETRLEVSESRTLSFPATVKLALDCKRAFGAKRIFEKYFYFKFHFVYFKLEKCTCGALFRGTTTRVRHGSEVSMVRAEVMGRA